MPTQGSVPPPSIGGAPFKPRTTPKIPIDPYDVLNLTGFLAANRATSDAIRSQKRAAMAGIVNMPYIPKQFFRQTAPNLPFYEKQSGMLNSAAGRLARGTSDINKASAIMLSGATQGIGLREKGMLADQENVKNVIDKQMQSDRQTDLANVETLGKNKMSIVNAEQRVHGLDAAKTIGRNQNLQNYLQSLGRTLDRKGQEAKYKNYYNLATGPESYQYSEQMTNLQKEAEKSKAAWDEQRKSLGPVKLGDETWENTYGKDFAERAEEINKQIGLYQRKLYGANLAMQMPVSFAKGGSVSMADKKELIRYRHELSREERDQREFYKMILKNNEMMLKSLSRIFK